MPAYVGGPNWSELDAALALGNFRTVFELAEHETTIDVAERQLIIGICHTLLHHSEQAIAALVDSFRRFGGERPARAAVAAVFLGRLHYFLHDSPAVANGWFARARSLVADQPESVEQVLVALPLPVCDIPDVTALWERATAALSLARRLNDHNLQAKALADLGTAQVSRAHIEDGMTLLDEAMTMVLSGEADSPFASTDVVCNLLSACARAGDLRRADQWTRAADLLLGLSVDQGPAFLYTHCRSNLGLILCDAGRWDQAEVALRLATSRSAQAGQRAEGQIRAALADLWVLQGRLDDAERLLAARHDHPDSILPLAGLHLPQRAHDEAISVAQHGMRLMGDDRMRVARLLAICVEAELGRGNPQGARSAAEKIDALATGHPVPALQARAALARGPVAEATGETSRAVTAYEAGLHSLTSADWPLVRAELHLALGRTLATTDQSAAISEARAADLIFERLGSPAATDTARLLNQLGVAATARPRRADATASLTRRESEVLKLLRGGLTNAEIAAQQHNSVRTIEHHVSAILAKLGLRSRAEAAAYAASLQSAQKLPPHAEHPHTPANPPT